MTRFVMSALALAAASAAAWSVAPVAAARPAPCPSVSVLADAERIAVMESGTVGFAAEIRTPKLTCTVSGRTARSSLNFWIKGAVAPEAGVANRTVPYFVAIIANGQVIDKKVFSVGLPFAGPSRKVLIRESVARIDIPIAAGRTPEDYSVTIGFQLTPEQALWNRSNVK